MAKNVVDPTVGDSDGWDTISSGLGQEWDWHDGPLVGNFLGTLETEVPDKNSDIPNATRTTNVHQFAPSDAPDETVFIWGSVNLDKDMANDAIQVGDLLRITYLGKDSFTGKDGKPRTANKYKVQAKKLQ